MSLLYKFISSEDAVLNIAKGCLKFTPIKELNDPTELIMSMNYDEVRDSLNKLRRHGMNQDQLSWLHKQEAILDLLAPEEKILNAPKKLEDVNSILSLGIYENIEYMKQKLASTIEKIRKNVGVLSLTLRYDSLPMWAHYSDLARGFVIEFNNLESEFIGDK